MSPAGRSKRPTSSHGSLGKWPNVLAAPPSGAAAASPGRFSLSPINSKRAGFSNCYRRVAGPGRFSPSSINSKRAGFYTQRRGAGPVRFSRRRTTPSGQASPSGVAVPGWFSADQLQAGRRFHRCRGAGGPNPAMRLLCGSPSSRRDQRTTMSRSSRCLAAGPDRLSARRDVLVPGPRLHSNAAAPAGNCPNAVSNTGVSVHKCSHSPPIQSETVPVPE